MAVNLSKIVFFAHLVLFANTDIGQSFYREFLLPAGRPGAGFPILTRFCFRRLIIGLVDLQLFVGPSGQVVLFHGFIYFEALHKTILSAHMVTKAPTQSC